MILTSLTLARGAILVTQGSGQMANVTIICGRSSDSCVGRLFTSGRTIQTRLLCQTKLEGNARQVVLRLPPMRSLPDIPLKVTHVVSTQTILRLCTTNYPRIRVGVRLASRRLSIGGNCCCLYGKGYVADRIHLPKMRAQVAVTRLSRGVLSRVRPCVDLVVG